MIRPLAGLGLALALPAGAAQDYWVFLGAYTSGQSRGIQVARLTADGRLDTPRLAAPCVNPSFLATEARQRFLYAISETGGPGNPRQGNVLAFKLDRRAGELTPLNEQFSGGDALCHVSVDPSGRMVMVASYGGGSVSALPVRRDGSLGPPASFIQHHGSSVNPRNQTRPHAHCITPDPAGRFALVADLGLDQVLGYRLDPKTATLTANDPPLAKVTPGFGPRHLAFSTDGKFVHVINEMDCSVTTFAYDRKRGALAERQTVSTLAGATNSPALSGAEIVAHPGGRWLYTSTRGLDVLSLFAVEGKTGRLTHVENVSSGGRTPRNFNLTPDGKFLLAANQNSDSVVVFRVDDATGRLTPTGSTATVGNPSCVLFVPVQQRQHVLRK
jgi:6-phosphogluconolactonase